MITVKVERVRKKAGLNESYDTEIKETIEEMIPYIESKIKERYLQDEKVLPILNLGATEIIAGQFMSERAKESEEVDLTLGPVKVSEKDNSKNTLILSQDLENKGWKKIKPYLTRKEGFYFGSMIYD